MEHKIFWPDHFQTLTKSLWKFYSEKTLSDFTISSDSKFYNVHNIILSAASPIFDDLHRNKSISNNRASDSMCLLPVSEDLSDFDFELFTKLCYVGNITIDESELLHLYHIGELFKAHMLTEFNKEEMSNKLLRITWTQHQNRLLDYFSDRLQGEGSAGNFYDIVFVTDDGDNVYAHSCIVAAISPVILELSKNHDRKSELTILLPCVTNRTTNLLLEFIYTGEVILKPTDYLPLLSLSRVLKINVLIEKILSLSHSNNVASEETNEVFTVHSREPKMVLLLQNLLHSAKRYTDIFFYFDGQVIPSHTNVLYLYSPCIKKLLDKAEPNKNFVVLVKDLKIDEFKLVIDCIYGNPVLSGYCISLMKNLVDNKWLSDDIITRTYPTITSQIRQDGNRRERIEDSDEENVDDPEPLDNTSSDHNDTKAHVTAIDSTRNESEFSSLTGHSGVVTYNYEQVSDGEKIEDGFVRFNGKKEHTEEQETLPDVPSTIGVDDIITTIPSIRPTRSSVKTVQEPLHTCNTCGSGFYSHKSFRVHLDQVHPEGKIMKCSYCNKGFVKKSQLQMHLRSHTGVRPFSCKQCGSSFTLKSALKKHSLVHSGQKDQSCEFCGKSFARKEYLEEHRRTHTGSKPYKCDLCHKSFVGKTGLNHHTATHSEQKKTSVCEICGKAFSRHALWTHVKSHDKDHACDICGRRFSTQSVLIHHIKGMHLGEKQNQCPICGKGFIQKNHLRRHMTIHGEHRPFFCTICHRTYPTESKLQSHISLKHATPGEKPFSCDICQKKFAGRSTMIYHRRVHTDERPHQCTYCTKTFIRPDGLRQHLRFHTGEKPFECGVCQKKCSTKSTLNKHLKSHENDGKEGNFPCDACGQTFPSSNHLNIHKRVHSGEKPYTCEVCRKIFRYQDSLKKHSRVHTGERPYVCPHCGRSFSQQRALTAHFKVHTVKCTLCHQLLDNSAELEFHLSGTHGVVIPANAIIDNTGTINIIICNKSDIHTDNHSEMSNVASVIENNSQQYIQLDTVQLRNEDPHVSDLLLNMRVPTTDIQTENQTTINSTTQEILDSWNITYISNESQIQQL